MFNSSDFSLLLFRFTWNENIASVRIQPFFAKDFGIAKLIEAEFSLILILHIMGCTDQDCPYIWILGHPAMWKKGILVIYKLFWHIQPNKHDTWAGVAEGSSH